MARLAQTAGLTDIQEEILATVRTFVDKEIIPHAQTLEHGDTYPADIVEGMKEMGLFGLTIPEEYGGLGESLLTYALVVEQIARVPEVGEEQLLGDRQEVGDEWVAQGVVDGVAVPSGRHESGAAQHAELLGQVRRLDAHEGLELPDGAFAVDEDLEGPHPGRMGQRLEQVGLDLVQRPVEAFVVRHLGFGRHGRLLLDTGTEEARSYGLDRLRFAPRG